MSILKNILNAFGRGRAAATTLHSIDAEALNARLAAAQNMLVLDVRNAEEFAGPLGHIAGAINIPLAELDHRRHELEPHRARTIAVVCLTDKRSTQAIHQLSAAGFTHLLLLSGGMKAWTAAQLPVAN